MNVVALLTATLVLAAAFPAFGQTPVASTPTPLSQLLAEANNPQISAADDGARAARQMTPQVKTLPDPKFTYQQFSVGSPKPFAGYTNSDSSAIGNAHLIQMLEISSKVVSRWVAVFGFVRALKCWSRTIRSTSRKY